MASQSNHGRRRQRLNAWLTGILVVLVLVQGNRLAREHLGLVRDITEDQLFLPSPVGLRMLGELQDDLQVTAYFTGDVKAGSIQIAKRRLIDQLEEFVGASGGRMSISYRDPNESTEARREAQVLGILPASTMLNQGVSKVAQDVWLGLSLRYRGKESILKWVLPQYLESKFLGALRKVTRDEQPCVGFLTGDGRNLETHYAQLRADLGDQYELREVVDLSLGEPIAPEVDVLVVVQPTNLHPRVAYAVDQFIQGGGRALLLLDGVHVDIPGRAVYPIPTGLESLLEAWGIRLGGELLYDRGAHNALRPRVAEGQPSESIDYPFWPQVSAQRLNRELPVTAALQGVNLYWPQELSGEGRPGLEVQELLWSTDETWALPYAEPAVYDMASLPALNKRLGEAGAKRRVLGLSLSGRFPSAFQSGVPAPIDPIQLALHEGRVERALAAGQELPALEVGLTDEVARSAELESQVVLIADADWAREGGFFDDSNRLFFSNLVDWLALESELLALRSRMPIERPIADFLQEERAKIGLTGEPEDVDEFERITLASYENAASELAARRRWVLMGQATGGALLAALLLGMLWRFCFGRAPAPDAAAASSARQGPRPGAGGQA